MQVVVQSFPDNSSNGKIEGIEDSCIFAALTTFSLSAIVSLSLLRIRNLSHSTTMGWWWLMMNINHDFCFFAKVVDCVCPWHRLLSLHTLLLCCELWRLKSNNQGLHLFMVYDFRYAPWHHVLLVHLKSNNIVFLKKHDTSTSNRFLAS